MEPRRLAWSLNTIKKRCINFGAGRGLTHGFHLGHVSAASSFPLILRIVFVDGLALAFGTLRARWSRHWVAVTLPWVPGIHSGTEDAGLPTDSRGMGMVAVGTAPRTCAASGVTLRLLALVTQLELAQVDAPALAHRHMPSATSRVRWHASLVTPSAVCLGKNSAIHTPTFLASHRACVEVLIGQGFFSNPNFFVQAVGAFLRASVRSIFFKKICCSCLLACLLACFLSFLLARLLVCLLSLFRSFQSDLTSMSCELRFSVATLRTRPV